MFRRLECSVPRDFIFPEDLNGLGYFINEQDQIRQVKAPDQKFNYFCSKNLRHILTHKEAFNACVGKEVLQRLFSIGMQHLRLPLNSPADQPHVPILVSDNLNECARAIVFVSERCQELGILAGRIVGNETINSGSAVDWVMSQLNCEGCGPGIVIANPGQLIWWAKNKKAVSFSSFEAIPRSSAVAPGFVRGLRDQIPKNRDSNEHVECVFEEVVGPLVERGCKIDVVCIEDGACGVFGYLDANWDRYKGCMEAMVICSSYVMESEFSNHEFQEWFGKRARAFVVSHEAIGTPLCGRDKFGCNVFSGEEVAYVECIFPRWHDHILPYFEFVHRCPDYENIPQNIPEPPPADSDWGGENSWIGNWGASNINVVEIANATYGLAETKQIEYTGRAPLQEAAIRNPPPMTTVESNGDEAEQPEENKENAPPAAADN